MLPDMVCCPRGDVLDDTFRWPDAGLEDPELPDDGGIDEVRWLI